MWRAAKVCFLYIGTVIGAGFASGREIALFFGDTAPWNVALAALFMAVPQALFLTAGKAGALPNGFAVRTGVLIAALSSVAAMLAGCELALYELCGIAGLGAATAVAAGVTVAGGTEKMKLVSAVLIPLLLVLLLAVYLKSGAPTHGGSLSLLKPAHYAGLDVLMGGMIISREGRNLRGREIVSTCLMSAVFLAAVLFMLQNIVLSDEMHSSMPVIAVADQVGLKTAAGVLVVIAVFTTLVSALDILTESVRDAFARLAVSPSLSEAEGARSPALRARIGRFAEAFSSPSRRTAAVFVCLAALYPVSFLGFETIVDALYPFVGLCGVAMTVLTALSLAKKLIKKPRLRGACFGRFTGDRRGGRGGRSPGRRTHRRDREESVQKDPRRGNGGCPHRGRPAL